LQDRSLYFGIPEVTWVDAEGDPLENKHFDPDYWVDNDPKLEAEGRDQQLEKAVEVLLGELGAVSRKTKRHSAEGRAETSTRKRE
jgi:hypothetical protein